MCVTHNHVKSLKRKPFIYQLSFSGFLTYVSVFIFSVPYSIIHFSFPRGIIKQWYCSCFCSPLYYLFSSLLQSRTFLSVNGSFVLYGVVKIVIQTTLAIKRETARINMLPFTGFVNLFRPNKESCTRKGNEI